MPLQNLQQAANGGLLRGPIVGGVHRKCTEPETVVGFHHGGAKSLRRSAIVVSGVHRKCTELETVGTLRHGGAGSLRRSAIFVSGVLRA